jgi:hypothetical protein
MCLIVTYYYKNFESKKNGIMKIKGPFVKVTMFNEVVKGLLLKPKHEIKTFDDLIWIYQHPYYSMSTTFFNSHATKVAPHRQM